MPRPTKPVLLDASAVIAYLNHENGWEKLEPFLSNAAMSTVNFCEVLTLVLRKKPEAYRKVSTLLETAGVRLIDFQPAHARIASVWDTIGNRLGLSFGDKACLATGLYERMEVVTADRSWSRLETDLRIHCIR